MTYSYFLYLFSSSKWLSKLIDWIVKPNENGWLLAKKSSSYLIWMFLMSYLTPLNNLVINPRSGGSLNSLLCFAFLCSSSYFWGFWALFACSSCHFCFKDYLIFCLFFLLLSFSSFFILLASAFSNLRPSSTISCIITIFVNWSLQS